MTRTTYRSLAWTSTGLFATAGAEWRTSSWFRFLLGAGIAYAPAVAASNGSEWIRRDSYLGLNLEVGLRCMF